VGHAPPDAFSSPHTRYFRAEDFYEGRGLFSAKPEISPHRCHFAVFVNGRYIDMTDFIIRFEHPAVIAAERKMPQAISALPLNMCIGGAR
jgi:hypothetical protein